MLWTASFCGVAAPSCFLPFFFAREVGLPVPGARASACGEALTADRELVLAPRTRSGRYRMCAGRLNLVRGGAEVGRFGRGLRTWKEPRKDKNIDPTH